ncbi:hypothetical protein KFE25_005450 [Diacronema lutheri]|uniref:Centromere/kinetochore protein zw10 C-terminal domain-containing protein n=1 Tax=Diacronema lutheri TaxID=2081491 RepID=A0A8J5XUX8_DIALT|nr:hypothetical protein KFE25_005450 [Diacronema lutheri]
MAASVEADPIVDACFEENLDPNTFHADADALRATVDRLDARIDELKSQVFDAVRVHKKEFVAAYARAARLRVQVRELADELRAVAREAEGERDGLEAEQTASETRAAALRAEIDASRRLLDVLGAVAQTSDGIGTLDDALAEGRYVEGARALVEMEACIRTLRERAAADIAAAVATLEAARSPASPTAPVGNDAAAVAEPRVLRELGAQLASRRAALEATLDELLADAIDLADDALVVRAIVSAGASRSLDAVSLTEVLDAMAAAHCLDRPLAALGAQLAATLDAIAAGELRARAAPAPSALDGGRADAVTVLLEVRPVSPALGAADSSAARDRGEHQPAAAGESVDCVLADARSRIEGLLAVLRAVGGVDDGIRREARRGARADVCAGEPLRPMRALCATHLWPAVLRGAESLAVDAAVRAASASVHAARGGEADGGASARVRLPPTASPIVELRELLMRLDAAAAEVGIVAPSADERRAAVAAVRATLNGGEPTAEHATRTAAVAIGGPDPSLAQLCAKLPTAAADEWRCRALEDVRALAAQAGRGTVRAPFGLSASAGAAASKPRADTQGGAGHVGPGGAKPVGPGPATPAEREPGHARPVGLAAPAEPRADGGGRAADEDSASTERMPPWSSAARALAFAPSDVSACVAPLLRTVHALLAAACDETCGDGAARLMLQTARDAIDLYRALVPHALGGGLGQVPGIAMVVSNDCAYLAHCCATLGAQYGPRLPRGLRAQSSFAPLVLALSGTAADLEAAQINRQRAIVGECVSGAVNWIDDATVERGAGGELRTPRGHADAEGGVRRALHQLAHLSSVWLPSLAPAVAGRALCAVAERALADLSGAVLRAAAAMGCADRSKRESARGPAAGLCAYAAAIAALFAAALDGVAQLESGAARAAGERAAEPLRVSAERARADAVRAALELRAAHDDAHGGVSASDDELDDEAACREALRRDLNASAALALLAAAERATLVRALAGVC